MKDGMDIPITVSYTHLDVYKRQQLISTTTWGGSVLSQDGQRLLAVMIRTLTVKGSEEANNTRERVPDCFAYCIIDIHRPIDIHYVTLETSVRNSNTIVSSSRESAKPKGYKLRLA